MGSMIYLRVGRLEIDWGKNSFYNDHRVLFQAEDLREVPYYYVDRDADVGEVVESEEGYRWKLVTEVQEGYSKPLREVVDRVELLGHTETASRREFSYLANLNGFDEDLFAYDKLAAVVAAVDVTSLSLDYGEGGEDFGKFFRREIFPRLPFDRLTSNPDHVRYEAAQAMENLSAYTLLRLLRDNPTAQDLPVIWEFADVVGGGHVQRSEIVRPLAPRQRFSILTEGTSDAAILKHALQLLEPHIADFFSFVEVGHPFSGTGQVINFVKGLIAIGVHNDVLVVFDNDAEGRGAWERCRQLTLPDNLKVLKLPDCPSFEQIEVEGPGGPGLADINGRAAAIECYLDLGATPRFRWSNYNHHIEAYQGELIGKDEYKRAFLSQTEPVPGYDYSKLRALLGMIKREAIALNEASVLKAYEEDAEQAA